MSRTKPYITFELQPTVGHDSSTMYPEEDSPKKRWYQYLPLCLTVGLLLMPHPSLLIMLVKYHLNTLQSPFLFITHLLVAYSLSFLALSSLMLCVVRDPGPVTLEKTPDDAGESEEVGITQALMGAEDFNSPGKWCRKCWAPKPERTHHCSQCGRCVLKMDHHCPWIASKCIGHRTYPAFVHFLGSVTLLALYIAVISISALVYSFNNAIRIDDMTPVHELLLACAGLIFSLVIGSFFSYHVYLVTTNQTTLENINQFIVLRYLPPLPPLSNGRVLSDPPMEHELSYPQRRIVRHAHGKIRMYDVGWRRNWAQVFGWNRSWGWVYRILVGGGGAGDGRMFPHNPRCDDMLAKLANELIEVDKQK